MIEEQLSELTEFLKDRLKRLENKISLIESIVVASATPEAIAQIDDDEITEKWLQMKAPKALFRFSYKTLTIRKPWASSAEDAAKRMQETEEMLGPLITSLAQAGLVLGMERES